MGVVVGQPSAMGEMLTEKQAEEMIFGFVILNDWSARDIQQWEYVPLGPFQAKAFGTSISPWVVTREALEPFRLHGPAQDPKPLPYLQQAQPNNYDMALEVGLRAAQMNEAANISRTNFKYMYWSSVQQLVHHASSGCAMNVGDLLGSGTISGPEKDQRGSLLEISWNGTEPVELAARREADVPGRRRFAGHARLVPGRRLSRRLWRGRGDDFGGGVTLPSSLRAERSNVPIDHRRAMLRDCCVATAPAMTRMVHRSCGGISRSRAQCAATSSTLYFKCTRLSDGNCFVTHTPGRRSVAGRIGRRSKPPPQFGQTLCSLVSTQSAQNVHS